MLTRKDIIEYLKNFSEKKPYVYAMWLEGADGLKDIDKYSDIDFWFDTDSEHQVSFLYEITNELNKLSKIDSKVNNIREKISQSNVHLKDTPKYLTLDICVQSHEVRGLDATTFTENDFAETPLVIFDKKNIISFVEEKTPHREELKVVLINNKNKILQKSRVTKYIKRKMYLEAYLKYIENIADPLVETARLIYTPRHFDYGLCHISKHLPRKEVRKLEELYEIVTLRDIKKNIKKAEKLFKRYEKEFYKKYKMKE